MLEYCSKYEGGKFTLISDQKYYLIDSPLSFDDSYSEGDFDVYFLAKKNVKENDIFEVHSSFESGTERIGWTFPITALDSEDHDFFENRYFLKYAYIGAVRALTYKPQDKPFIKQQESGINNLKFSDIFHESTVLLVVCKKCLNEKVKFDINRACSSLIKYGYVRLSNKSADCVSYSSSAPEHKKLKIKLISESINDQDSKIINDLLNFDFACEEKPVFQFFFLYQIIELMIDLVFEKEQVSLFDSLNSGNVYLTKEKLRSVNEALSEGNRIQLLENKYTNLSNELNTLKGMCNSLLAKLGKEPKDNFKGYFYPIRNYITHQYRNFPDDATDSLKDVVEEFTNVLPDILASYKPPV